MINLYNPDNSNTCSDPGLRYYKKAKIHGRGALQEQLVSRDTPINPANFGVSGPEKLTRFSRNTSTATGSRGADVFDTLVRITAGDDEE